jgi:hypothetical protein
VHDIPWYLSSALLGTRISHASDLISTALPGTRPFDLSRSDLPCVKLRAAYLRHRSASGANNDDRGPSNDRIPIGSNLRYPLPV